MANPPSIEGTKICGHCKKEKPKVEFVRSNTLKSGFSVDCKECQLRFRENRLIYKRTNKKWKEQKKQYKKSEVGKQVEARYRKTEKRKISLEKYNNSDKKRLVSRRYVHRRRVLIEENGGAFTSDEWSALCEKYDHKCLCCGEKRTLTIDHIVPITLGGNNNISNIQPLCMPCNLGKGQKIIDYRN